MKIDYELVEKIGATHYNISSGSLYKVKSPYLLMYIKGNWERSGLSKADIVSLLKPITQKPQVRVEYQKVEYNHIWEVMKMQSEGVDLYVKTDATESGYGLIQNNPTSLLVASTSDLYRRIEKSVDWAEEVDTYFLETKHLGIDCTIEEAITSSEYRDEFLEVCRVALRANGEL